MIRRNEKEIKVIYVLVILLFLAFLAVPILRLLGKSFEGTGGLTAENYIAVLTGKGFGRALLNSLWISVCSALLATLLAFFFSGICHSLHQFEKENKKSHPHPGCTSHAASHHHLWICNHLFFWKTGTSDKTFWASDIRDLWI